MSDPSILPGDDPRPPGGPARGAVEVTVDAAEAELVADLLFGLGASAVEERSGEDAEGHRTVVLVADLSDDALAHLRWPTRRVAEDPGWATAWQDAAVARACGERLVVRPVWTEPLAGADGDRLEVLVDPGTSFGSAAHPSTRLCLAALEPLAPTAGDVLDVGSGSGVLGCAALLLGASRLVAIDVDAAAIEATSRAVDLNGVAERARVAPTPLADVVGRFDLVLANLLLPIVEELGPTLADRVATSGALVLGGLLDSQLERAVAAVSPLELLAVVGEDGWVAATFAPL